MGGPIEVAQRCSEGRIKVQWMLGSVGGAVEVVELTIKVCRGYSGLG